MPELLTRGELCGLGLEDCPNGRLQIGTLSGFISERRPASRRNTRPDKIGIYTHETQYFSEPFAPSASRSRFVQQISRPSTPTE